MALPIPKPKKKTSWVKILTIVMAVLPALADILDDDASKEVSLNLHTDADNSDKLVVEIARDGEVLQTRTIKRT